MLAKGAVVAKKKKSSRGLLVRAYAENISANLLEKHGDLQTEPRRDDLAKSRLRC
jgi:hypothetical protein